MPNSGRLRRLDQKQTNSGLDFGVFTQHAVTFTPPNPKDVAFDPTYVAAGNSHFLNI